MTRADIDNGDARVFEIFSQRVSTQDRCARLSDQHAYGKQVVFMGATGVGQDGMDHGVSLAESVGDCLFSAVPLMLADTDFAMPKITVRAFARVAQSDNFESQIFDDLQGGFGEIQMGDRKTGSYLMDGIPTAGQAVSGKDLI